MQQYINTVTTRGGAAVSGASVLVKTYPADATATIYSDDGTTEQDNPITTDANGRFAFYAADGRYTLVISKTGVITQLTLTDSVLLADPDDEDPEQSAADVSFTASGTATSRTMQAKGREIASAKDSIGETYGSDDTTAFQNRITDEASSTGREILVNAGTLVTTGVTLPGTSGQQVSLKGDPQTIIQAKAGASVVVAVSNDITRTGFREIKSLRIDGNDVANVTGLKVGNPTSTALQVYLRSLDIRDCEVGMDLYGAMENSVTDVVCYSNTIGAKLRQDATGGGGNANRFDGLRVQSNTVGLVLDAASSLPMHNNQFNNLLVQSNSLCGIAMFGLTQGIQFNTVHLEANGTAGTTLDVDGNTVRKSVVQINDSTVVFNESTFSQSVSPCILLENGGRLLLKNSGGYGSTTGIFIEGSLAESVEFHGHCKILGVIKARVDHWPDTFLESASRWSGVGLPLVQLDRTLPNDYAMGSPYTPLWQNAAGGSTINANVADAEMGLVSSVTFAASAGSTSSNRATCNALPTGVTEGDTWVISFLAKADQECELRFNVATGNHNNALVTLDTIWRRVVIVFRANTSNATLLYNYPEDDTGATVYTSRIHALRVPTGGDMTRAYRMVAHGLFNDKGISALPTPSIASRVTTAVGNVGTGEDNLQTYSLPASALAITGQGVRITAWGTAANNANAKTLKLYFGSAVYTATLTQSEALTWEFNAIVLKTGTDTQDYKVRFQQEGTTEQHDIDIGTLTEDDGAAITIKCTGEATSNNDIVQEGMLVEFLN